ncbi:MAG: hypothetical protein R2715_04140 [Ilumatobacteraceae bacterium]
MSDRPEIVAGGRPVVIAALPLKRAAREHLAELLGARVVDIRDEVERADVVLSPPVSPQMLGRLRRRFQAARVVVVELDDAVFDLESRGPVKRMLDGGADAYVLADSLEELAAKLLPRPDSSPGGAPPDEDDTALAPATPLELHDGSTVEEVVAAFLRESVEYSVRHR